MNVCEKSKKKSNASPSKCWFHIFCGFEQRLVLQLKVTNTQSSKVLCNSESPDPTTCYLIQLNESKKIPDQLLNPDTAGAQPSPQWLGDEAANCLHSWAWTLSRGDEEKQETWKPDWSSESLFWFRKGFVWARNMPKMNVRWSLETSSACKRCWGWRLCRHANPPGDITHTETHNNDSSGGGVGCCSAVFEEDLMFCDTQTHFQQIWVS